MILEYSTAGETFVPKIAAVAAAFLHSFVNQHQHLQWCCAPLCLTLLPWHYWVNCPLIAYYPVKWPRRPAGPQLHRRQTSSISSSPPCSTLRVLHFPRDGRLSVVAAPLRPHTNRRSGNGSVRTSRNPTLSQAKRLVPPGVLASRCRSGPVFEVFRSVWAAAELQQQWVTPSGARGGAETPIQTAAPPGSSCRWERDGAAAWGRAERPPL